MFPTIYGVALRGLGEDTKVGAAGLVMAILGGAILPLVHGRLMDLLGAALAYAVPGVCLALRGLRRAVRSPYQPGARGVELITADAVERVESKDEAFGVRNRWG